MSGSERRTLRNFAQRDLAPLFLFLRLLRVLQPLEALLDLDCPRGCSSLWVGAIVLLREIRDDAARAFREVRVVRTEARGEASHDDDVALLAPRPQIVEVQQQLLVTQPLEGCEVLSTRRSPEFCRLAGATCSRPCCAGRGCGSKPRRSTMRPFRERSVLRQPCCSPACFRPLGTAIAGDAR